MNTSFTPLSPEHPVSDIVCDDITLRYRLLNRTGPVEFLLLPTSQAANTVPRRARAPLHPSQADVERDGMFFPADPYPDSLIQLHLRGDGLPKGFGAGKTMRHSESTLALEFVDQILTPTEEGLEVITRLRSPRGLLLQHRIVWEKGRPGVRCETSARHEGDSPVVVEHLSSFSLSGLSPFASDDQPERLRLHRFQSAWSLEGRPQCQTLEELHLERTWAGYGQVNLRFGQVGSLPVREYFPFAALEDTHSNIIWGANLVWHGSWQMEVHRRGDPVTLAGSHADFEFGHWCKTLHPGEELTMPPALLSCAIGGIEPLCRNLVLLQETLAHPEPEQEHDLPILFNEWCSTWGNPTHDKVLATAKRLEQTPTGIFVIDDGWAERPGKAFQTNGDWKIDTHKFPHGLLATTTALRESGLRCGIWFEFEVANQGSHAYTLTDHQLTRHGQTLTVGTRRFWDFRDPWTHNYLREKVIELLRENNFSYLKVDYNDSIGTGCDVPDDPDAGLGEGLRQHLLSVMDFFRSIRRELPDLVIENCSSGGHRLEPGMVGLTSMSSFSDAHECVEIPVIAANLLRLIPARKNQIWVVLRPEDSIRRLLYGFAATFMGRMAVSGDLTALSPAQQEIMDQAQALYREVHPLIRDGDPVIDQHGLGPSMRYPAGQQTVQFLSQNRQEMLLILHTFAQPPTASREIPLPPGTWTVARHLGNTTLRLKGHTLQVDPQAEFSADILYLRS